MSTKPHLRTLLVGTLASLVVANPAFADSTFVARSDRSRVALGEAFLYEITLSLEGGEAANFRPPDFKAFRVLGEHPSQSTQIQMGGGGSFMRTVYSWRYELQPLAPGTATIGPARVRLPTGEVKTSPVTMTVGDRGAAAPAPANPALGHRSLQPTPDPPADAAANFIRAVVDKPKVFVGEQVIVQWFLYLTERQDRYQALVEPRTDGFWSEDLPVATTPRGLSLTQETVNGRGYLVAPLLKKALFPLAPGKLSVTSFEAEVAQVDFFGSSVRSQHLTAAPVQIEVVSLPTAGQPVGFNSASVGKFTVEARLDRDRVAVGEAVTLTLVVSGRGNLRQVTPPKLEALAGWKHYEPKVGVELIPGADDVIGGRKTVEYLLLPERPGVVIVPAFELPHFDPSEKEYAVSKSVPLRIEVVGEAGPALATASAKGAVTAGSTPVENVLPVEIRPLRAQTSLRRSHGTTFYRTRAFVTTVAAPPVALGFMMLVGRVRQRLGRDTERARRRKLKRMMRKRLGAAEAHLDAGKPGLFTMEIERVLHELLAGRLGQPVTGFSRDELRALLIAQGLASALAGRTLRELDECDRARFAPGEMDARAMREMLQEAEEIIFQIERSGLARTQEVTLP